MLMEEISSEVDLVFSYNQMQWMEKGEISNDRGLIREYQNMTFKGGIT
jgi:hypothetical protein